MCLCEIYLVYLSVYLESNSRYLVLLTVFFVFEVR